jgi:hypothetical protein
MPFRSPRPRDAWGQFTVGPRVLPEAQRDWKRIDVEPPPPSDFIDLVEQSTLPGWPDTGIDRDPEIDVLRLVQPLPGRRDRGSGGWQAQTAAGLEQDQNQICIERYISWTTPAR